jgi:hypothetical protein
LITALGILVEPEVKRNLVMVSGPVARIAASMAGVAGVAASCAEGVAGAAFERGLRPARPRCAGHGHFDGTAVTRGIGGEHQARRQRVQHVAQLLEVLAHQRVGRRHRAVRHAGIEAAEREQRVLDAVLAEDRDRALGVQAAVEQRLPDAARLLQGLRIATRAASRRCCRRPAARGGR